MITYQGLSTLEVLVDAKNYNNWIASELTRHLKPPILEIGAGIGNISGRLIKKRPYYLTDIDEGLVTVLKDHYKNEKNITCRVLNIEKKPPKDLHNSFSSVVAVNVLEHIKDDTRALSHIHSLLKKNGTVVLLIPAKRFAYTRLDKDLGHYRRYEKDEIISKLVSTGFRVKEVYFFNIVGLLSWVVRDKVERSQIQLRPYQVKLFDSIVPVLRKVESYIRPSLGISLIVVGVKE